MMWLKNGEKVVESKLIPYMDIVPSFDLVAGAIILVVMVVAIIHNTRHRDR